VTSWALAAGRLVPEVCSQTTLEVHNWQFDSRVCGVDSPCAVRRAPRRAPRPALADAGLDAACCESARAPGTHQHSAPAPRAQPWPRQATSIIDDYPGAPPTNPDPVGSSAFPIVILTGWQIALITAGTGIPATATLSCRTRRSRSQPPPRPLLAVDGACCPEGAAGRSWPQFCLIRPGPPFIGGHAGRACAVGGQWRTPCSLSAAAGRCGVRVLPFWQGVALRATV
jgi:hypothetical protein